MRVLPLCKLFCYDISRMAGSYGTLVDVLFTCLELKLLVHEESVLMQQGKALKPPYLSDILYLLYDSGLLYIVSIVLQ